MAASGEVSRRKGSEISLLAQEVDFGAHASARDYVLGGLERWTDAKTRYQDLTDRVSATGEPGTDLLTAQSDALEEIEQLGGWNQMHRVDEVAGHLGIANLDQPLNTMSGGERRRVALARLLIARPPFAILDEPTNHLDVETIEWLESHLVNEYPGALLVITHDRYLLDNVAQRTLELENGSLYSYQGGWESYLIAKAERQAHADRAESNRQNTLRRELEWLRRSPKARSTKQQARVDRVVALRDQTQAPGTKAPATLAFEATRTGKTIVELSKATISIGEKLLIEDLDLILRKGDRIGIVGKNGAGKTSLLRALQGKLAPVSGRVTIGANTRFAYFDQERAKLDDDASIRDNVAPNSEKVVIAGQELNAISYLARFQFVGDKQKQKVATLSGGERARVAMAKFLLMPANVLLLDEPTNDLDVTTLAALEDLLTQGGVTVLFVTHDRYFLDKVATSVLSFEGQGRVTLYADRRQAARALEKKHEAPTPTASTAPTTAQTAAPTKKGKKGLTITEKHELRKLMPLIEKTEAALAILEAELADPTLYEKRGQEVPELLAKRDAVQLEVDQHVARWEELESKRANT